VFDRQVLVKFFDTGDYSWIPHNKVCKYRFGSTAPDAPGKASKVKGGAAAAAAEAAANGASDPNDPSYIQAVMDAQTYLSSLS
jgi:hypothetical protein